MKFGVVLLFLLSFSLRTFAADDNLHSFARGLNSTLRHLNRSEARPCSDNVELRPRSAKTAKFQNQLVTVLSEDDAQKLFTELKNQNHIPYNFAWDGCQQRAHEMSRLMLLKGVTPLKVFAVAKENGPRLQVNHPRDPNQKIVWRHHVAPMILVEGKDGKAVPYALDPSIESKAVPVNDWVQTMTQHAPKFKPDLIYRHAGYVDYESRSTTDFNDPYTKQRLQELKELADDPAKEAQWHQEMLDMAPPADF